MGLARVVRESDLNEAKLQIMLRELPSKEDLRAECAERLASTPAPYLEAPSKLADAVESAGKRS
jgi:predicted membrane chloride channel (bestrophin family)